LKLAMQIVMLISEISVKFEMYIDIFVFFED